MREEAFRIWLQGGDRGGLDLSTISSRCSNCRTVERHEGDLDQHFNSDRMDSLLQRLTYSSEDQRLRRPARHKIPINGNIRNGTATLRSAASLYKRFRESEGSAYELIRQAENWNALSGPPRGVRKNENRDWPKWSQPASEEILAMAYLIVPFVRFLNPEIVRALVEDNERHRAEWIQALEGRRIDSTAYLWEKSPCAFPGVRRYAGSKEIAAYRGHTQTTENLHALYGLRPESQHWWSMIATRSLLVLSSAKNQ